MKVIDNRGLLCPEPVIQTKNALAKLEGNSLTCLVDNPISRENVVKFAKSQGYAATVSEANGVFSIVMTKNDQPSAPAESLVEVKEQPQSVQSQVQIFTSDELGRGDADLGRTLMKAYFYALSESDTPPQHLLFVNAGARLTCLGSDVLPSLERLAKKGYTIKTCGLCLDFYGLKDQLAIGEITNMYTIIEHLGQAAKVTTL